MSKEVTDIKIGVLGGGQLGRMMLQAAINLNLNIAFLDPDPQAPCASLSHQFTTGKLTDFDAVYAFGRDKDLITIEIENVNTDALKKLESEGKKVFPQPHIIELIQDKRKQKTFYKANRIPTADFVLTESRKDVEKLIHLLPAVHKLGKEGYDGKGVQVLHSAADVEKAFDKPGLLETKIDFKEEISVIVARNEQGDVRTFPVVALSFHPEANLVEFLYSPSGLTRDIELKAEKLAVDVIEKLDMVGLLAVEMFLTQDNEILVNEIAPRTHNSGHHTIEANVTSQFEQHIRAITGLPLGDTAIRVPAAMVNVLGEPNYEGVARYQGLDQIMQMPGVHVHLYGKALTKPFRKMGHVTVTDPDASQLKSKAMKVKETLKVIA